MQQKLTQHEPANYETERQHRDYPPPSYEEHKLGSAQPNSDPFDAVGSSPAGVPVELIAADRFPIEGIPAEGLPPETQATDFMTAQARPQDFRPRDPAADQLREHP
jgi:hypothetical protein